MSNNPLKITGLDINQHGDCWTNSTRCEVVYTVHLNRKPTETEWESCWGYISIYDESGRRIYKNGFSLSMDTSISYAVYIDELLVAQLSPGTHTLTAKAFLSGDLCNNTPVTKSFTFTVKTYQGEEQTTPKLKPVSAKVVRVSTPNGLEYHLRIYFNRTIGDTDTCGMDLSPPNTKGDYGVWFSAGLNNWIGKDYAEVRVQPTISGSIRVRLSDNGTCAGGDYILTVENPYIQKPTPQPQPSPVPPETQTGVTPVSQPKIDLKTVAMIGGALGVLYFLKKKH